MKKKKKLRIGIEAIEMVRKKKEKKIEKSKNQNAINFFFLVDSWRNKRFTIYFNFEQRIVVYDSGLSGEIFPFFFTRFLFLGICFIADSKLYIYHMYEYCSDFYL